MVKTVPTIKMKGVDLSAPYPMALNYVFNGNDEEVFMKMACLKKWRVVLILFVLSLLVSSGFSRSHAAEKKKEDPAKGVTIVALDVPMRATIGKKVNVDDRKLLFPTGALI